MSPEQLADMIEQFDALDEPLPLEQMSVVATTIRRLAAENAALRKDAERLDWMQFHGGKVCWGNDGEVCNVIWQSGDGYQRATTNFADWRDAIDTAMQKEAS